MKSFSEKKKLKMSITTKPVLYEMLKGLLEEKKLKNINNKRRISIYLSTIESKKQNKQTSKTETEP